MDHFHLNRLGEKRILFSSGGYEPIISLYIDPPSSAARWKRCEGMDLTGSLFHRLKPWAQKHGGFWFVVSFPQDEYSILHWIHEYEDQFWSKARLWAFDEISSGGGAQYLGFLTKDRQGALIFKRNPGLEIAFYGNAAHWAQISAALEL